MRVICCKFLPSLSKTVKNEKNTEKMNVWFGLKVSHKMITRSQARSRQSFYLAASPGLSILWGHIPIRRAFFINLHLMEGVSDEEKDLLGLIRHWLRGMRSPWLIVCLVFVREHIMTWYSTGRKFPKRSIINFRIIFIF